MRFATDKEIQDYIAANAARFMDYQYWEVDQYGAVYICKHTNDRTLMGWIV